MKAMDMDVADDLRDYEIAVLMANELDEPLFGEGVEIVEKEGPKAIQLAYPIKKHASASLRVYVVRCSPENAAGIAALLKSNASVIRHLLITPPIVPRRRIAPAADAGERSVPKSDSAKQAGSSSAVSNQALEAALTKILDTNESQ